MKSSLFKITAGLYLILLTACFGDRDGKYPVFPEQPTQKARQGFKWEIVSGTGLQFWAQRDSQTCVVTDGLLEGAVIKHTGRSRSDGRPVIKIFHIEDGDIDDVLDQLEKSPGWNSEETCKFKEVDCDRKGVTRYILLPTGDYADRFETAIEAKEAIPSTCNGWGTGNSGRRYFEIHDSHPDKAIFVEIGQEQPLFDPESIVLTDIPLQTVRGELVIGHEVRTFTSCGDTMVYWIKDLTEKLLPTYDNATQGTRNGYPAYAELQIRNMGKSHEGFAAGYAGVYEVTEVREVKTVALTAGKNYDSRKISVDSLNTLVTSASLDIIYTPTPGEKDIELNAPENVLPFLEVYVNKNGTLFVNMKHFADISSDTPFSIELKAPPMDTFHNKGTGTLILKDGAYSDGDVHITANGPVICGPITCRDLYISATSDKSFHADQQFPCRDVMLHAKANASIDLTGGITCRLLHAQAEGGSSINAKEITATDVAAQSSSSGTVTLTGSCTKAALANASRGNIEAEGLQAMDATASVTGEGTVSCHATRKIEGEVNGTGSISYKGRPRIICKTPSGRDHINPIK